MSLNYRKAFPGRHIECFVAEQNMIGVAMGCSARGRAITFTSTFAAFFTRTFDHLRMGAVSQTSANLCGSHCGVSIGKWISPFLLVVLNLFSEDWGNCLCCCGSERAFFLPSNLACFHLACFGHWHFEFL